MGKLSLGLGLGIGYVLGAQAGRARYEQIKQAAAGVMERPEVQQALERARAAAPAPLQDSIGKLSRRSSRAEGTDPGAEATLLGDVDVVVTPPPPVTGAGGPGSTDTPVPDPLLPPAKSGPDANGQP